MEAAASDFGLVQTFTDEHGRTFNFIHLSRPNTKRLLVHFTAFFGEWGERKEYRENYQGYFHRLRMLKDIGFSSVLFVCDQYGTESNGTYYTGKSGDFFVERAVCAIIEQAMQRDGVGSEGLVMAGSSAGATGALKFGLMFNARGILAICPHIDLDTSAAMQNRMPHVSFVVPDGEPMREENRIYTRQITNMVASRAPDHSLPRLFIQSCQDDHGVHHEQVVPLQVLWRSRGGEILLDARKTGGHTSEFATRPLILDVARRLFEGRRIYPKSYAWQRKFKPHGDRKTFRKLLGSGLRAIGLRKPINNPVMNDATPNVDPDVAAGFGHEWSTFKQGETEFSPVDREAIFRSYFQIFPWQDLPAGSVGIDVGCGSGRWSVMVAPRVGHLHLLDASADALAVARQNLAKATNVSFHLASVGDIPIDDNSLDFAFSLGVLHHVPDTTAAVRAIAAKLKVGAPFLLYLYYALDNRPWWYRAIWRFSNIFRIIISPLPPTVRLFISQIIAVAVYWPLARLATLVERAGLSPSAIPLESYRNREFYVMRTDAYDRFCTRLEQRFTRGQIEQMLTTAGFDEIRFSDTVPYWCAVAKKQRMQFRSAPSAG